MLRSLALIPFFCTGLGLLAQVQPSSTFGGAHTPKGNLHILLVFVRYEDRDLMNDPSWPNVSEEGILPSVGKGKINSFFNDESSPIGGEGQIRNLSEMYYNMSGGVLRLTGDIFPIQVPIKYIDPTGGNAFTRQGEMNKRAVEWIAKNYPDFDWGKYDRRTNRPNYQYDNSVNPKPDGILDYVIFMHRAPGSGGIGSAGNIEVPKTEYKITHGHTGIASFSDAEHNWEYFRHEFSHNLFDAPHYLGANSTDGTRYYTQKGWGFMAAWHAPFYTCNAWESWWLGWTQAQEITQGGIFTLKDFATQRDAMRIRIPGTNDYLWLENHQKIDPWDKKIFFSDPVSRQPSSAKGVYAYVVAEAGSDRSRVPLNPFNPDHANLIKVYNAEGNFDYLLTGAKLSTGFFDADVFRKANSNPISGQNDFQFIRLDYNNDNRIEIGFAHGNGDMGGREQKDVWAEESNSIKKLTLANTGDENDAFLTGTEISISGIVPPLNYPSYNKATQRLNPYFINGISIKIGEKNAEGSYTLSVNMNDWTLKGSKRWCGNLLLATPENKAMDYTLNLASNAQLDLDLSGTSDRETPHPTTESFANPTLLRVTGNNQILLQPGSQMHINAMSTLELSERSQLIISEGATLTIAFQGSLRVIEQASILVQRGGTLVIESDATLFMETPEQLRLLNGARVRDKR